MQLPFEVGDNAQRQCFSFRSRKRNTKFDNRHSQAPNGRLRDASHYISALRAIDKMPQIGMLGTKVRRYHNTQIFT